MRIRIFRLLTILITVAVMLFTSLPSLLGQSGLDKTLRNRFIKYYPASPIVDQRVTFESIDFTTQSIDWNFGDGTIIMGGNRTTVHRYQSPGTYTVTAKDTSIDHVPVVLILSILPENRSITVSPKEAFIGESVTVQANNFRTSLIHWDFGDGTITQEGHTVTHAYNRTGTFTITAREGCQDCLKTFTDVVQVVGVDDQVHLEIAEILLDNGKGYKVVAKNATNIHAVLRLKLNGSGTLSGYWVVDDQPFEFFQQWVNQGEFKEIRTAASPGLPVMDPGIHTVTLKLTQPENMQVTFPVLKYYVLPGERKIITGKPQDRFVAKEDNITSFAWAPVKEAVKYEIAFSEALVRLISQEFKTKWLEVGGETIYTPELNLWNTFKRNRWTYWKVRAMDADGKILAESDIQEIKVVVARGDIRIKKATDLKGREITLLQGKRVKTKASGILVHGVIDYKGESNFMVLRVYVGDTLTDRLLFRDVEKNKEYSFETYIPHKTNSSRVYFELLKTSSPAVIVGVEEMQLLK